MKTVLTETLLHVLWYETKFCSSLIVQISNKIKYLDNPISKLDTLSNFYYLLHIKIIENNDNSANWKS